MGATAALSFGSSGAEETSQVMKALDERRSGPLSMTSLAWETQIKLRKTSENLVVGLVNERCAVSFFFVFDIFFLVLPIAHRISLVLPLEDFWNSRKIVGDINDNALAL